jgi:class 3 adenylate cyclase/tetratricopeptide (TPR) repeat protein
MKCSRCQHENPTNQKFCGECGARLASPCPSCGATNPPGQKFCGECGASLTEASAKKFGSPDSYTPKHLAEKILTSKSALEGERKQVTVLFADLKGSMELLADRDPEEARKLLDPVLERMMEAVHRYEGTVNQVMGDGIMALFGAPLAHEDHAVRACYAALRMQEAVRRYSEELRRAQGVEVQIRVGLNSGDVVVRSIGSDLRMDYSAVGQTTHLAARMEQLAAPGSVRLTAATLRPAEGFVQVSALGPVPVKGLAEPVEVFELIGAGAARTRLEAAARRGLTRFVGRDAELEHLYHALERARSAQGQVVAIVGEPGVGKSRLVWEITHSHRTSGWLVLQAGSVSYGKATPYLPAIELLKGYCQIEDRDDHRRVREKVIGKLLNLDDALKPTLPAFLALLDVPGEDPQWDRLDPAQRRQRTLDAVKRLLLRESQVQPLLVIIEDLHWIDTETQTLLDTLVDSLPTARLLLLVNYRPEYQHGWGSKTYYTQLRLDPLPPENAQALLGTLLGQDPTLDALKQRLIERTEGNPFFLEESVRTLVETRALAGERGHYYLATPLPSIQVPTSVQAILAARIDRLPPEAKSLLGTAAVVGSDVPVTLLQALAERAEPALREALASLQAAEFLYETRLFPEVEYTFKHALTQEVAYGSLLHERRRALHARLVDVIERLYPDRLGEQVERLAHHAVRGELWDKAVAFLRQAGAKASARSAYREAAQFFGEALSAWRRLPDTRETRELGIDLRLDLRMALQPLAELARIIGLLRDAEELAKALGDRQRLARVSVYLSHHFRMVGDFGAARRFAETAQAIATAETPEDPALEVVANYYLGMAHLAVGDHREGEAWLRRSMHPLDRAFALEPGRMMSGAPAVLARYHLAWSAAEQGRFEEGLASGEQALRLAEGLDHPFSVTLAYQGLGRLYEIKGEFSTAAPLLERGRATAREWNLALLLPIVTAQVGYVYALSGRVADGLSLLREAMTAHESLGVGVFHSLAVVHFAEACMLADQPEEAFTSAKRALAMTRERGDRGHEAYALRLLAEIAARPESLDRETAHARYHEALTLATELGMRPLVAHCHLGLGKLYRRTGQREPAQAHLTTATTLYREMGMTFWLEQAESEMRDRGA